jgi:hypothetical protein
MASQREQNGQKDNTMDKTNRTLCIPVFAILLACELLAARVAA